MDMPIDEEENKRELFGEMANKWQDDTNLPMIIWIDEGRLYQRGRHAKRIKFQLNTSDNVDRRKMGEMDLFGNVLEPTGKKVGGLRQYQVHQLQNFVNNNHYALEKISDTEIRISDIWDYIIMGGEKAEQSQIDVLNATVDDIIATKKATKKNAKGKGK